LARPGVASTIVRDQSSVLVPTMRACSSQEKAQPRFLSGAASARCEMPSKSMSVPSRSKMMPWTARTSGWLAMVAGWRAGRALRGIS